MLDAMNNGVPVIGYSVTFEGIDVKYGISGLLAENTQEFCEEVNKLCADKQLAMDISVRDLIAEKYDSNKISKDYSHFISECH